MSLAVSYARKFVRGESSQHHLRAIVTYLYYRPYRAPETIFSATDYDPFALDLWSLGATFAEFFTSLRFIPEDDDIDAGYGSPSSDSSNQSQSLRPAFINPPVSDSQRGEWTRKSLFDAERGSIGLAWSIFKVRGTPDDDNWPVRRLTRYLNWSPSLTLPVDV